MLTAVNTRHGMTRIFKLLCPRYSQITSQNVDMKPTPETMVAIERTAI